MLYNNYSVMRFTFRAFYFTGRSQISLFFFNLKKKVIMKSNNVPVIAYGMKSSLFRVCEVKYCPYIPEVLEKFIKYFVRYSKFFKKNCKYIFSNIVCLGNFD